MFVRNFQPPPTQLLLLHGLFGHTNNLRAFADILHQVTKSKISSCDLRNHGQSLHGPMNLKNIKNDLDTVLKYPIVCCGHSLGGKILMHNIDNHNIKAGIVLDIAPKKSDLSLMGSYIKLMIKNDKIFENRNDLKSDLMREISNEEIVQFLMTNLKRNADKKWEFQMGLRYLLDGIDEMSTAASIKSDKPMLFIRGDTSDYILEEDEKDIKTLYPNSKILTVPGSHWVHFQSPNEIAKHINEFLKTVEQLG